MKKIYSTLKKAENCVKKARIYFKVNFKDVFFEKKPKFKRGLNFLTDCWINAYGLFDLKINFPSFICL
jgi:hypothetical protein